MTPSQAKHRPVAVERTLEIFSDSWSFAVLQEVFFGVRRFGDFQSNLAISRSVLTRRLKHLVAQKILERRRYSTRPARYEYRLTERGRDMYPIFVAFRQWGERWLDDAESHAGLRLIHRPCEHGLDMKFCCRHCGKEIHASDVHYDLASSA